MGLLVGLILTGCVYQFEIYAIFEEFWCPGEDSNLHVHTDTST